MAERLPQTLLEKTLALLQDDSRTLPEIYRDTGIPFYWLRKFARGEIQDPSVNRVQKLYEHLSGRLLNI